MQDIKLHRVHYIPNNLEPRILYVSEEYCVAAHLCPCGCGHKVITPIGPTDWSFEVFNDKPSLYPSIGNWQIPCKSHYWVTRGEIVWSYRWTEEEIEAGRKREGRRDKRYFDELDCKRKRKKSIISRLTDWILSKDPK
jgi:hypothetical protein